VFLTELTSPYSLNTQRRWHTSQSVIGPAHHGPNVSVQKTPTHLEEVDCPSNQLSTSANEVIFTRDKEDISPWLFIQEELNYLTRD